MRRQRWWFFSSAFVSLEYQMIANKENELMVKQTDETDVDWNFLSLVLQSVKSRLSCVLALIVVVVIVVIFDSDVNFLHFWLFLVLCRQLIRIRRKRSFSYESEDFSFSSQTTITNRWVREERWKQIVSIRIEIYRAVPAVLFAYFYLFFFIIISTRSNRRGSFFKEFLSKKNIVWYWSYLSDSKENRSSPWNSINKFPCLTGIVNNNLQLHGIYR